MKDVAFLGSSLDDLKRFPQTVQQRIGYEIHQLQIGEMPSDFKSMSSISTGIYEIRVRDETGAYRTIYTAKFDDKIYILHAFKKKTEKTAQSDLDLATARLKQLVIDLKE